jgi:hypothetical protein
LKPFHRYILLLFFFELLILGTGFFIRSVFEFKFSFSDLMLLSSAFLIILILILTIFFRGQTKEPDSQTLHSIVSLSLKFLLELVLALGWFIVAKKISLISVLLFFILYLGFTLFSVWVILKTLKDKSL